MPRLTKVARLRAGPLSACLVAEYRVGDRSNLSRASDPAAVTSEMRGLIEREAVLVVGEEDGLHEGDVGPGPGGLPRHRPGPAAADMMRQAMPVKEDHHGDVSDQVQPHTRDLGQVAGQAGGPACRAWRGLRSRGRKAARLLVCIRGSRRVRAL